MRKELAYIVIQVVLLAVLLVAAVSCKTAQPVVQGKDSVRVEYKRDSVYIWQHDSIFRDRWRNGDTVFVTVEKWQVRLKDKVTEVHDTITTSETIVQEVKYVPEYYKHVSTCFWILLAILVVIIGWKIAKIYFKIQSGGLIK